MARLALLALLALAFSTVALAAPQQDVGVVSDLHARAGNQFYLPCGDPTAVLSLNVSPDPPEPGAKMDVLVGVLAHETVVKGTQGVIIVSHGPEFLRTQPFNICRGNCPISPGPYTFSYEVDLPVDVHPDELTFVTRANSPEGKPLFCFEFQPNP